MKHSILFLVRICVLYAFISTSLAVPWPQEKDIERSGDTLLSTTLAKKTISVDFHTTKMKKADAGFPLALAHYEDISVVRQMTIAVNGQDVWVPRSAYADLFDPRKAYLRSENGVFVLLVGGADGSDSYSVHIRFDATRVISRTVYDTMSPPRISEKTIYSKTEMIG